MNNKKTELLYRSMDCELTPAEQQELQQALAASDGLRAEEQRLAALRGQISAAAVKSFNPFFAEKVMNRLRNTRKQQNEYRIDFFESLIFIFRRVLVATAVIVILLISYNVIVNRELSVNDLLGFQDVTYEDVWLPIDTASWETVQ